MTINLNRLAHRDCLTAIATRQAFSSSTGSLHGTWTRYPSFGYAPEAVRDALRAATGATLDAAVEQGVFPPVLSRIFVVYSYATPIAYAKEGGDLVVFDVKYSNTTSRHSSLCRNA